MKRWRFLFAAALGIVLVGAGPSAATRSANPGLFVNFFTDGTIAVTLADGTPVGSTAGAPTVIPSGYYSIVFSGPGGCSTLPNFKLNGPGMSLVASMYEGAVEKVPTTLNLQPSATYTWIDDALPSQVHTFTTSTQTVGAPPQTTSTTASNPKGKSVTSHDVVGSQVAAARGTIAGAVSPAGRVTLSLGGKRVRSLKPGRYTVSVVDRSPRAGFTLRKSGTPRVIAVTGPAFEGKHSAVVRLTAGKWLVAPAAGKPSLSISVR